MRRSFSPFEKGGRGDFVQMINQTNPPRSPFFKGGGAAWWLTCALASSLWCLTSAARSSATFDEPLYVKIGLEAWRSDSHAPLMRWGTMPLPADVQTLPLYAAERWRGAPFDPNEDLGVL